MLSLKQQLHFFFFFHVASVLNQTSRIKLASCTAGPAQVQEKHWEVWS